MALSVLALVTLMGRLDVSTGTPDALCPTLSDAEAAIVARVGDVSSGDYGVRYDLARSSATSGKTLRVVLSDARGEVLLRREIELEDDACESAALALALVVERFFERIVHPETPETKEGETVTSEEQSDEEGRAVRENPRSAAESAGSEVPKKVGAPTPEASSRTTEARGGRLLFRGLAGVSERRAFEVGFGVGYRFFERAALVLDANYFLGSRVEDFRGYSLESEGGRVVPAFRFWFPIGGFGVALGPIVPVEFEWARGETLDGATSRFRTLLALGGEVAIDYRWHSGWSLEFAARLAGRFVDATKAFSVVTSDGSQAVVLGPEPILAFGQIALGFPGL